MQQFNNPQRKEWAKLCLRPNVDKSELDEIIQAVYEQVTQDGDDALLAMTKQFDGISLSNMIVDLKDARAEGSSLEVTLRSAIDLAFENIKSFHKAQFVADTNSTETIPGVLCWREVRPIESVGLYIPGGTAPLISTMLMLGVPAMLAKCKKIVVCTPPSNDGSLNAAIRYAASKCGIRTIYTIGGAQAIAAMAVGTKTVPRVSKIYGPGNQYVTAAKQMAERYNVAIDMPAGPSEVLVIADNTARADFVAADLLSQAEHGTDSQVILLTNSPKLQFDVESELKRQLQKLPRCAIATVSLQKSLSILFDEIDTAYDFSNEYAPEHIIIQTTDANDQIARIINAGSVFIGGYTPESAGDYASGTNHTLPTNGWAKSYSGVSLASFQRMVTFQEITPLGLANLAPAILPLAEAEGLRAHSQAVSIRLNKL